METANSDPKSICQIGVAVFKNGDLIETWSSLINPQSHFDFMNSAIHGITEEDIRDAPTITDIKSKLDQLVGENVAAIYSGFDKVALEKNFPQINYSWLDITKVVRRTWEGVAYSGYGLANVCKLNDIEIGRHHDALADAVAAGRAPLETAHCCVWFHLGAPTSAPTQHTPERCAARPNWPRSNLALYPTGDCANTAGPASATIGHPPVAA